MMTTATLSMDGPMYAVTVHASEEIGGPTPLALNREWVLTNGLGGFAMGTVSGCATRRYHGLLIAAARPPVDRVNTLAAMTERVWFEGHDFRLDCHEFLGPDHHHSLFEPHGFQHLGRFEKDTSSVRWRYRVGPISLTKELRLVWRKPAAVITYTAEPSGEEQASGPVTLELTPLLAMRDFHQHRRSDWGDPFGIDHVPLGKGGGARLRVTADAPVTLHLESDRGRFVEHRDWWYNFHRRREVERGQDGVEDLFNPGSFEVTLEQADGAAQTVTLYVSTDPIDRAALDADDGRAEHLSRCAAHVRERVGPDAPAIEGLVAAADDFVASREVAGEECRTIIAGYPWFSDWGRDTMISLPGLLLCTGRVEEAGKTLITYARHIRNGLVPNRFDDYGGEPHYNTVDASLWFIHAALLYREVGDAAVWGDVLAGACRQIIAAYQQGTDGPIAMDRDGLISAGNEQTQLTWMDAKRDGVVFTPRHGKCVEINALWHRALVGCAEAMRGDDPAAAGRYKEVAAKVERSFRQVFWDDALGYLLDHANDGGADRSLRPNQVLAVSLPDSPLRLSEQRAVMRAVRERLLTPRGLRTLPRDDPNYHGRCTGSMFERDSAYHRGTVWPWLIGPYVEGWLRAHRFSDAARRHAREAIAPLIAELPRHSIGQLHEVFDGDEPHHPAGCIAQAWSVAELLRAVVITESPLHRHDREEASPVSSGSEVAG